MGAVTGAGQGGTSPTRAGAEAGGRWPWVFPGPSPSTHARVATGHRSAGIGSGGRLAKFERDGISWPSLALTRALRTWKARVAYICTISPCLSVSALVSIEEVLRKAGAGVGKGAEKGEELEA